MKVVIFAGGIGTRISEESHLRPKPMIEVGEKPLLWHIMKIFAAQGFNDFIICLGYKGYMIKEYFYNYYLYNSDITIELKDNQVQVLNSNSEDFKVTLVDTGLNTKTAGRLQKIKHHIQDEEFMLTYGDGVADININNLLTFHKSHGKAATVTAVQPVGRFGVMHVADDGLVQVFKEKKSEDEGWINGGFFVLNKSVFDFIPPNADDVMWEDLPIQSLAAAGQIMAYQHNGFWKCMDALRDKMELEEMWNSGNAKWKVW